MTLEFIDQVTLKYGEFRLTDYLLYSKRSYATFLIDYSLRDIIHTDGLPDDDLKEHCKEGLNLHSKGIYALYGERQCRSSSNPVEVLMIEKDLWESNDEELKNLLIFHEVCHLIEKTNYYKNLEIDLSEYELRVGLKLHEIANNIIDMLVGLGSDENHNQTFGAILFHFLNQYDNENCHQLLAKSMIKNFGEDYTQEFKEII
jgi:hypothetical protein